MGDKTKEELASEARRLAGIHQEVAQRIGAIAKKELERVPEEN